MYPRLVIDLDNLAQNLDARVNLVKEQGHCSLMIVTKGLCADPKIVKMAAEHPEVDYLADSRVKNLASYADLARKMGKETVLLRLPMESEIEEAVKYADISFNSELKTLRLLNEEAGRQNKIHKVVLMIDLGDLREGIFFKDEELIFETAEQILNMKHLDFYGIAVNLTCYGAIIPTEENLSWLCDWAEKLETKFGISLKMVSGGNSSSVYLIEKGQLPAGINNLRLGEAFLLGKDTAFGMKLLESADETMTVEAQIIEIQKKPSMPIGQIGVDAFGRTPEYEDKGVMKRAIIAIGRQDADPDSLFPTDEQIEIIGASSDHMILDISSCVWKYKVGDIVSFTVGYSGMLRTSTSPYVEKVYKGGGAD